MDRAELLIYCLMHGLAHVRNEYEIACLGIRYVVSFNEQTPIIPDNLYEALQHSYKSTKV